ncbi:hypothetical protein [Cellulosimicrobium marinum]|uniref:hypothetical protein n=1 Tax=Cellulosimicrobium marinum TaxID=1638992 RepID=UPI001E5C023C|nr:hypothetical protein [Cellulosimicrobium marinum]MCB7137081.1 hypothetical protein [Cellulosimicrobium marinum]
MSAYSPTLPRTTELRGLDRALVLLGARLTELGRRRAATRARVLREVAARRTAAQGRTDVAAHHDERLRDNAAQHHPLLLR